MFFNETETTGKINDADKREGLIEEELRGLIGYLPASHEDSPLRLRALVAPCSHGSLSLLRAGNHRLAFAGGIA